MTQQEKPVIYHIPVCPFSQRLEILLALKGASDAATFSVVDITKPRDPALLALTGGTTSLPILLTEDGEVIKESLVILGYLEKRFPEPRIAQADPDRRAVEDGLIALADAFTGTGYRFVMNRDRARREAFVEDMRGQYAGIDAWLRRHNPDGVFLFEDFGLAEAVFTPMFMRFWFLAYYEDFDIPDEPAFARVRRWRDACIAHPAAQQVTWEEIVKLYYDYALGAGNGALPPGRTKSSFVFEPHWSMRPWPPRAKYDHAASDAELGLL